MVKPRVGATGGRTVKLYQIGILTLVSAFIVLPQSYAASNSGDTSYVSLGNLFTTAETRQRLNALRTRYNRTGQTATRSPQKKPTAQSYRFNGYIQKQGSSATVFINGQPQKQNITTDSYGRQPISTPQSKVPMKAGQVYKPSERAVKEGFQGTVKSNE